MTSASDAIDRAWRSAALAGAITWLVRLAVVRPSPFEREWSVQMLLLAPLVLVPLMLRTLRHEHAVPVTPAADLVLIALSIAGAVGLVVGATHEPSMVAMVLALPWLAATLVIAASALRSVFARGVSGTAKDPVALAIDAARVMLPIGAAWTCAAFGGVRPLGFEDAIVILTGVHFHYAGFLLPLFAAFAARETRARGARVACYGVVAGVPLTALGITVRQTGGGTVLEAASALITASAAFLVAFSHARIAFARRDPAIVRVGFAVVALALTFSSCLAAAYGLRDVLHVERLDIPWMRALHGSANALGFGLCGALAWTMLSARRTHAALGPTVQP